MERNVVAPPSTTSDRICMFCGATLLNRGEAYYDHLRSSLACESAWLEWTRRLDEDRVGGG